MSGYVAIIGGANIDIIGTPYKGLVRHDSAPGRLKLSSGGVARNIAENLARLGVKTELLTVFGDDANGQYLRKELVEAGVGIGHSLVTDQMPTSTYLCLNSEDGEMQYALAAMDILNKIDDDFITERLDFINGADYVVVDTNLGESLGNVLDRVTVPVVMDTVSTQKTEKCLAHIKDIFLIKPNREEAEIISGIKIKSKIDVENAAELILKRNVKNVIITLGKDGAYYTDGVSRGFLPTYADQIVSTTGAGDSFVAAVIMGFINGENLSTCVKLGSMASSVTVKEKNTVSKALTANLLYNLVNNH